MHATAAVIPAFFVFLPCTGNCHRTVRHVLSNRCACGGQYAVAKLNRRHQIGVAANEAVITDDSLALGIPVVVDDNRAAAEVYALTDLGIAVVPEEEETEDKTEE